MVGLIPLFAVETLEPEMLEKVPDFAAPGMVPRNRPDLAKPGVGLAGARPRETALLSLLRGHRMKRLLRACSMSRSFYPTTACAPCRARTWSIPSCSGSTATISRCAIPLPSRIRGSSAAIPTGAGPSGFRVNFLIIESLQKFHHYYGDEFKVECPTGSGTFLTIEQIAEELSQPLVEHFPEGWPGQAPGAASLPGAANRPLFSGIHSVLRIFHGDNGRGVAPRKTGWTALIAKLLMPRVHD